MMKRINVVGTSGSGKSVFSRELAKVLHVPHIEMDALFWKPGWQESGDEAFFKTLKEALAGESWVLDGNYSRANSVKLEKTDAIIWLDYSYLHTFLQILMRSLRRIADRRELWSNTGNRESFRQVSLSRKSIILWMMTTHSENRKKYNRMMRDSEYGHIRFFSILFTERGATLP